MPQESQPAPLHQRLLSRLLAPAPWQWLFLLLLCVISFLALAPVPPKEMDTGWDKANHFLAFGSLAFVGRLAWPRARKLTLPLGLVAYGGAIELIQYFVPGRSCEWADLFADSLGIAMGLLIVMALLKLLKLSGLQRAA
ncbi:VanZ family protein [Paucibacter sp. KCTC 42545]|uniref:VanZ family protein n=1 Tax=Paucibacter sp. KCTC 42545 TaxID=1768242 RepID=UPI0009EAD3C7|nr:VanZ family protein [Paucibacter sp. KCTC 42545]